MGDAPVIWRTKLRSTVEGVDHAMQVQHCLDSGLIGIGWRMDEMSSESSLDLVVETVRATPNPGWARAAANTIERFGATAKIGDFVWTRDTAGRYLLCRITGPYRYDGSDAAKAVDVHQVRDVDWAPPLNDLEVPGAVIRAFIGIGLSFSKIHDAGARLLTGYLWEKLNGQRCPSYR